MLVQPVFIKSNPFKLVHWTGKDCILDVYLFLVLLHFKVNCASKSACPHLASSTVAPCHLCKEHTGEVQLKRSNRVYRGLGLFIIE